MTHSELPQGPFTRAEAAALGMSEKVLRRLVSTGELIRIRSGIFWSAVDHARTDPRIRHAAIARLVVQLLDGTYALAGETAAAAHGLWTPRRLPDGPKAIRLYTLDNRNATTANGLHISVSPLFPGDLQFDGPCQCTSIPRTAIDLARGMSPSLALIPLDHALRLGVSQEELLDTALRLKKWRGTKLLRGLIPLATALSESPLETATRASCLAAGLDEPELQVPMRGASGKEYRVDLLWRAERLIVEPDGLGKYGETVGERREAFAREKDREDDLRAMDYTVMRVTWSTLDDVVARIARHLARHRRRAR